MAIRRIQIGNVTRDIYDARIDAIDSALSGQSANPVQNSAVTAEFAQVTYVGDVLESVDTIPEEPDTPIIEVTETDPVFSASPAAGITASDITSWNGKQAAISDLATIRSGAALGATALQSFTETDPTVPSWAKADNKPTYTASEVGALASDASVVTYTKNTSIGVAGTTKDTYKYDQSTMVVENGIVIGGTAAAAGLVTRGICGVTTPNTTTGACSKENLYINYDGSNTFSSGRQVILQAGTAGTHYGNNLYQYAAVRGDVLKNYCDATYLQSYTETDPVFTASAAHGISSSDITAWNAKQKAITVSSSEPTSSQGSNGDIWIVI